MYIVHIDTIKIYKQSYYRLTGRVYVMYPSGSNVVLKGD